MPRKRKERRQSARIQVPLVGTATYQTSDDGPKTIQVVAQNISEDGAYLVASSCPAVGDRTEISLRCDSGLKQLKISMEGVGKVTRVDEPGEQPGGFAVEFRMFSDLPKG